VDLLDYTPPSYWSSRSTPTSASSSTGWRHPTPFRRWDCGETAVVVCARI